ncbi:hypothetical protein [Brucella anthropi]|uniref:hypothetical protein n=1 Tax=Brucella anthropi TaxID=529 RepID=UPI00028860DA|nr:hypothetical protein [Brucella anthropi]
MTNTDKVGEETIKLLFKRGDGTFVAEINGLPYHVIPSDGAYWQPAVDEAARLGNALPFEPEPEPIPGSDVTILPSVTLWERMTDDEAEQVNAAMATQPFRTRQIFLTANTFRSDHELWPLLVQMATDLFGEERAAELLADPSELIANS